MTAADWFADAADAREYLGEVGRLWTVWLAGLFGIMQARGWVAFVIGAALLAALVALVQPLQKRVGARFGEAWAGRRVPQGKTLSPRDKALRELTYGRQAFGEAVARTGMWRGLVLIPWVVIGFSWLVGIRVLFDLLQA